MYPVFVVLGILFFSYMSQAQADEMQIVDFDGLTDYLKEQDESLLVINFWATWCSPCVEELPYFEKANEEFSDRDVKIILVSLDFERNINSHLLPFIKNKKIQSKVILLDDSRANIWINKVSENWSGAIPATWIISGNETYFKEGKYENYEELRNKILKLNLN